jgi:hypothetical protein
MLQHMKHSIVAALLVFALAACSPPAAEAPRPAEAPTPAADEQTAGGVQAMFMAPSGNIACVYTPAGGTDVYQTADGAAELSCDRNEPEYVRIVMSELGAAQIVPTDERSCCSGEVIPYGERWIDGPFICDVSEAGVRCSSTEGHGFTLSRTQADVR